LRWGRSFATRDAKGEERPVSSALEGASNNSPQAHPLTTSLLQKTLQKTEKVYKSWGGTDDATDRSESLNCSNKSTKGKVQRWNIIKDILKSLKRSNTRGHRVNSARTERSTGRPQRRKCCSDTVKEISGVSNFIQRTSIHSFPLNLENASAVVGDKKRNVPERGRRCRAFSGFEANYKPKQSTLVKRGITKRDGRNEKTSTSHLPHQCNMGSIRASLVKRVSLRILDEAISCEEFRKISAVGLAISDAPRINGPSPLQQLKVEEIFAATER